jgi:hypothetical protein
VLGPRDGRRIFGPSFFGNSFIQRAFAETIGDRYVVVIYLDGGNDGLNTVTPADNGLGTLRTAYDDARDANAATGGIGLSPGQLSSTLIGLDPNTNCQLAIHPGMTGLKSLYDLGKVAVIQGCGYPDYNLSHEESRGIWQTGDPPRTYLDGSGSAAISSPERRTPARTSRRGGDPESRPASSPTARSAVLIEDVLEFDFPSMGTRPGPRLQGSRLPGRSTQRRRVRAVDARSYIGNTGLATYLVSQNCTGPRCYYEANRPVGIRQA